MTDTTPTPPDTPELPALTSTRPRPTRASVIPLWLLAIGALLVLALGLAGYLMMERLRMLETQMQQRVELVDARAAAANRETRQDAAGIAAYGAQIGSQEVQLAELRARIDAYEYLADDLVRSYDERVLSEVEHALVLGQQQLQLAGDAKLALTALAGAETRLARADTGRYLPLRRAMAHDMERLRRAPMADLAGQALRIDTMLSAIDSLPLAFERPPAAPPQPDHAALAELSLPERLTLGVWTEIRQLVRIERLDRPDPALLSPAHSFFLRENLKLRLINARIALLQRNGAIWREDIGLAREWIERHFDTRAQATTNVLTTLRQLASVDPGEALPGLDESMSALAQLKTARKRAPVTREGGR
jgi:uroporphyrin-III C-methyltransferase